MKAMIRRFHTGLSLIPTLILLVACIGCSRNARKEQGQVDGRVVLRVGDNKLTMSDVNDYFRRAYYEDIQIELEKKNEYVQQILEQYMLAAAAIDAGHRWEIDSSLVYEALLRELHEIEVADKIEFTDDDVREYFDKFGGEIQAGHILVADSALAESLYNVLQKGGDFDELAGEYSNDLTNKDRGGSLGYMNLDYYDVKFMRAASLLKIGEISRPLQTVRGWHIIKLYDRIKNSRDYLESRMRKYRNKTYNYYERKRLNEYKDEVKAACNYEIVQKTVDMMIQRADSLRRSGNLQPDLPLSSYLRSDLFTEPEKEEYMVRYDGGGYTVKRYVEYVETTDPSRTPNLGNKIVMESFFDTVVLTPLLVKEAFRRGIDTLETFKKRVKDHEVNYLVQQFRVELMKDLPAITDEEIERYYNDHKSEYYTSDNMKVLAVGVKHKKEAVDLLDRLKAGAQFEQLARKYSVDRRSAADGGDLGYFAKERYPELFDAADRMNEGEVGGPVEMFGSWWIFKLVDRRPAELRPLNRVRAGIVPEIRQQREQAVIDSVVDEQKAKTDYFVDLQPIREELGLIAEEDRGVGSD